MRSLAIPALLMLALAGLALPTATADTAPAPADPVADAAPCACPPPPPPPRCPAFDTVGPIAQVVRLAGDQDCNVTVYVLPAIGCAGDPLDGAKAVTVGKATVVLPCGQIDPCEAPFDCAPASAQPPLALCDTPDLCNDAGCPYPVGAEDGTDVQVGPVPVHSDCGPQDLCSGPFRCTSPFGGMSAAIPPVCIQREAAAGPVKAGVDSCREDHEDTTCSNGSTQRIHYYVQEGPAYAQVHVCLPHAPPPGASASSAQALPVEVHVVPSQDPLHVDVYVKADVMDCLWGEGYNPTPVGPAATVWVWGCRSPYPPPTTASASQPCICPPPRPLCYEVNRAIAWGDQVQADDYCNVTVTLTADCGLQGTPEDHQQKVGNKVTINYQTCQGPPPASSSASVDPFPTCIRDCSPLPDEACQLRDATPAALQHPLWGYDCTLDIETSCLDGSSGGAVQERIGFVNIDIALCGGGPDPASAASAGTEQVPPCACPPPQPLCYEVSRSLAASPYYSIDDSCNVTITLEANCGLQGYPEDHELKAPKLTVDFQTCKYVPPA